LANVRIGVAASLVSNSWGIGGSIALDLRNTRVEAMTR
jgi:hypothetical protein